MTGLEVAAGAGVALSAYGAISGANAQANAQRQQADLKRQQADELLAREAINEGVMAKNEGLSELQYSAAQGDSGFGGGVGGLITMRNNLAQNIANSQRDADFKAKMLRLGANVETSLASDTQTAGYITGAGTILTGGLQAYHMYAPPSSKTESLPNVGT